jgi:hypothetical protein
MAVTIKFLFECNFFTNPTYCGEQFFYYFDLHNTEKLLITRDTLFTAETSSCGQFIFYFDFVILLLPHELTANIVNKIKIKSLFLLLNSLRHFYNKLYHNPYRK